MSHKEERTLVDVTGEAAGTYNFDFGSGDGRQITAFLNVSAATGTPTLDIKFQEWDQASGTWFDIPTAAFTQATGVTSQRITFASSAPRLRCNRVVAGTTPTFDYTVGYHAHG